MHRFGGPRPDTQNKLKKVQNREALNMFTMACPWVMTTWVMATILEIRKTGIPEFRNSGIPDLRVFGFPEFRIPGFPELHNIDPSNDS